MATGEVKPGDATWFSRGLPDREYDIKKGGYVYKDASLNPTDEETAE